MWCRGVALCVFLGHIHTCTSIYLLEKIIDESKVQLTVLKHNHKWDILYMTVHVFVYQYIMLVQLCRNRCDYDKKNLKSASFDFK